MFETETETRNPLALDADTMREMAHRTVDELVDMLCEAGTPALRRATPEEMARRLPSGAPEAPADFDAILGDLRENVFPFMSRLDHPGYFAFIPACGTWPGVLGDFLAAGMNVYAGTWMEAAGPSRVELIVLEWFKEWIGYPASAAGVLVSGGSAANITALACAREALLGPMTDRAVAYACDQSHSSVARAARLLGFRSDQVRVLPCDSRMRLRPDVLAAAIDADARAGREPLFVAVAAGSTNTGTVDPIPEIAAICRERGAWLHVDGAYGAFAALTDRGREAMRGIELADSVTLDPHKWLYQPFECGALLVRDGRLLDQAFAIAPDYLKEAVGAEGEVNFCDRGLQLSRSSRAIKIWLSIRYFGLDAFRAAIDRCLDLALLAERHVAGRPELELMSPASLGIVCFRRRGEAGESEQEAARRNSGLVRAFEATGAGLVSSTRLHGRYAIRLCVMNHTSTAADVERVLDWFADAEAPELPARGGGLGASSPRQAAAGHGWLGRREIAIGDIGTIELFRGVSDEVLGRVSGWASELLVAEGDEVTRAWDSARDFYVILEGAATVVRDGHEQGRLGAGDFFGEIAALDWGAGYGYARSATVTATRPLRLLVLDPAHLNRLMAEAPSVAERIQGAVRARSMPSS
ncbi:MAG: aromatic-L-amino-acid/L-tryptophan decarboxylase [Thermoleophilaceae bacterium]|nr:aromatic-L-amino-acid/L-tryptophan decarboxylase [Thermoleophilaceae bacterium]